MATNIIQTITSKITTIAARPPIAIPPGAITTSHTKKRRLSVESSTFTRLKRCSLREMTTKQTKKRRSNTLFAILKVTDGPTETDINDSDSHNSHFKTDMSHFKTDISHSKTHISHPNTHINHGKTHITRHGRPFRLQQSQTSFQHRLCGHFLRSTLERVASFYGNSRRGQD